MQTMQTCWLWELDKSMHPCHLIYVTSFSSGIRICITSSKCIVLRLQIQLCLLKICFMLFVILLYVGTIFGSVWPRGCICSVCSLSYEWSINISRKAWLPLYVICTFTVNIPIEKTLNNRGKEKQKRNKKISQFCNHSSYEAVNASREHFFPS